MNTLLRDGEAHPLKRSECSCSRTASWLSAVQQRAIRALHSCSSGPTKTMTSELTPSHQTSKNHNQRYAKICEVARCLSTVAELVTANAVYEDQAVGYNTRIWWVLVLIAPYNTAAEKLRRGGTAYVCGAIFCSFVSAIRRVAGWPPQAATHEKHTNRADKTTTSGPPAADLPSHPRRQHRLLLRDRRGILHPPGWS